MKLRSILFFLFLPALIGIPAKAASHQIPESDSTISATQLTILPLRHSPRIVTFQDMEQIEGRSGLMGAIGSSPGYAFIASALIPGLGQAANNQWWKTAVFVAVEATVLGVYIHRENRGRAGERNYIEFGNDNWSVVQYARHVVDNHSTQHGYEFRDLLSEEGRLQYDANGYIDPSFDTSEDWFLIDIQALRDAEKNSLFDNGVAFSHTLHNFGSQQYYELMSKYFQFGPGWRKWDSNLHSVNNGIMPEDFWHHSRLGADFNNDLNVARNMLTALIANHFISAFDALFTQKFRETRIKPSASIEFGLRPTLGFDYRF